MTLAARSFGDPELEYRALRGGAGVSMLPEVGLLRFEGEAARASLDYACATPLSVRDGQLRQALLLDDAGRPRADVHLANDDGDYLLYGEGLDDPVDDGERLPLTCISINGPFAWELLAALTGEDVAGFPYLSFYRAGEHYYFRAGKTGEFGYDLFVPEVEAEAVYQQLLDAGARCGGRAVGIDALWLAALENAFFNLHREGAAEQVTAVELQLSWRLSFNKRYRGAEAIDAKRRSALERIVYFRAPAAVAAGDEVSLLGEPIGEVLAVDRSYLLDAFVGVALVETRCAHAGLTANAPDGTPLTTASAPLINNLSTVVKPGRHRYADRGRLAFSGWSRVT